MQIEVLSVSQPSYTKTENGGYNKIEVAYKQNGEVKGKNLVDFGTGKSVYEFFQKAKQGDKVEVKAEKNGKFWNWTEAASVTAATGQNTAAQESQSNGKTVESGSTGSQRGRVTGSNYETPEERAKRQIYIVRQSSVTAAIATLARDGTKELDPNRVIEIAKVYEAYVFGGNAPVTKQVVGATSEQYNGEDVPV